MYDIAILLAQTVSISLIAAWLATGVYDNIFFPELNETVTAQVMTLELMKEQYPEDYARVAHRAIASRSLQLLGFRAVVVAETIATLLLTVGAVALFLALFGAVESDTARALALVGATLFTLVWGSFLVVGNYFCYWYCHEGAQNTHYQMTLWGLGNMIFLSLG